VIRGIKENKNQVFIHSDVDIQYLLPIKNEILSLMSDKDILIQRDTPKGGLCAGFFACKGNKKTLKLFESIKKYMKKFPGAHDQLAMNRLLRTTNEYEIIWDYLPSTYMSGGTFCAQAWEPGVALAIPENPRIHHANWTFGINNKIAQLIYVKEYLNALKKPQEP
jgi:Nucleotide-diphospho-sugar transferase.